MPREVSAARAGSLQIDPWWKPVLNQMENPNVVEINIQSATQTSKTTTLQMASTYSLFYKKSPVLLIASEDSIAEEILNDRIKPTIMASPELAKHVRQKNNRDQKSRLYVDGADLKIGSARSQGDLASIACAVVIADEVALYQNKLIGNADPISLVKNRVKSFIGSGFVKCLFASTPKEKGDLFSKQINKGVINRWFVTCPNEACAKLSFVDFGRLKYPLTATPKFIENNPECINYECEHCGHQITEAQFKIVTRTGQYVEDEGQEEKSRRSVSYIVPGLLSTEPWADQVIKLLEAGSDPVKLQDHHNGTRGIEWEDLREAIKNEEIEAILSQSYKKGEVPLNCMALILGVDVGGMPGNAGGLVPDDEGKCLKYHTTTIAVMPGGRFHCVEVNTFKQWSELYDVYLSKTFMCPDNKALYSIRYVYMDSGGTGRKKLGFTTTQIVYSLAQQFGVNPTKGVYKYQLPYKMTTLEKTKVSFGNVRALSKPLDLLEFNPDFFKKHIWASIRAKAFTIAGDIGEEYAKHLMSEVRTTIDDKKGTPIETFVVKYEGAPNHYLDSTVIGVLGAMYQKFFRYLTWQQFLEDNGGSVPWDDIAGEEQPAATPIVQPSPPPYVPPTMGSLY